jgi:hypothetical protein
MDVSLFEAIPTETSDWWRRREFSRDFDLPTEGAQKTKCECPPDYAYQSPSHCIDLLTEPEIVGVRYRDEAPRRPNLHDHHDRYTDDTARGDTASGESWISKGDRVGTASTSPPQRSIPRHWK